MNLIAKYELTKVIRLGKKHTGVNTDDNEQKSISLKVLLKDAKSFNCLKDNQPKGKQRTNIKEREEGKKLIDKGRWEMAAQVERSTIVRFKPRTDEE